MTHSGSECDFFNTLMSGCDSALMENVTENRSDCVIHNITQLVLLWPYYFHLLASYGCSMSYRAVFMFSHPTFMFRPAVFMFYHAVFMSYHAIFTFCHAVFMSYYAIFTFCHRGIYATDTFSSCFECELPDARPHWLALYQ